MAECVLQPYRQLTVKFKTYFHGVLPAHRHKPRWMVRKDVAGSVLEHALARRAGLDSPCSSVVQANGATRSARH